MLGMVGRLPRRMGRCAGGQRVLGARGLEAGRAASPRRREGPAGGVGAASRTPAAGPTPGPAAVLVLAAALLLAAGWTAPAQAAYLSAGRWGIGGGAVTPAPGAPVPLLEAALDLTAPGGPLLYVARQPQTDGQQPALGRSLVLQYRLGAVPPGPAGGAGGGTGGGSGGGSGGGGGDGRPPVGGRLLRSWPGAEAAPGEIPPAGGAAGVAVGGTDSDGYGYVYVADAAGRRVVKFDRTGREILSWRGQGSLPFQWFEEPAGLAADGQGFVYVVDRGARNVQKYDGDGGFRLIFGKAGELVRPEDVAVDGDGYVYVTDSGANAVVRFNPQGQRVAVWTASPALDRPAGVAVEETGGGGRRVWVADAGGHRLVAFDAATGQAVQAVGRRWQVPAAGYEGGALRFPSGVAVLPGEALGGAGGGGAGGGAGGGGSGGGAGGGALVLAVEAGSGRVQAFSPDPVAEPGPGVAPPSEWPEALPGAAGPRDTKALVMRFAVAVGFTPAEPPPGGSVTYQVYRHERHDGRAFVRHGAPVVYRGNGVFDTEDRWTEGRAGQSGWRYDGTYGYLFYIDPDVSPYEEYYYLVASDQDRWPAGHPEAGRLLADPNRALNAYVVNAAFPPTQTRHGNYTEYTDACTACHGLHSAQSDQKLLKGPTVTDLCGTCHDGSGSKYDIVLGRTRTGPDWSTFTKNPAGPFGTQLREVAGAPCAPGFPPEGNNFVCQGRLTAVHNVMRAGLPATGDVTALAAQVWQAPGSTYRAAGQVPGGSSWTNALTCISCHEPHNKYNNFRLLRGDYGTGDYQFPVAAAPERPGVPAGLGLEGVRRGVVVRGVTEVYPEAPPPAPVDLSWQDPYYTEGAMASRYLAGSARNGTAVVDFCTVCHRGFAGYDVQYDAVVYERSLTACTDADPCSGWSGGHAVPAESWTERGDALAGTYRADHAEPGLRGLRLTVGVDLRASFPVLQLVVAANGRAEAEVAPTPGADANGDGRVDCRDVGSGDWQPYDYQAKPSARCVRVRVARDDLAGSGGVSLGLSIAVPTVYNTGLWTTDPTADVIEGVYGRHRHRMSMPASLARGDRIIDYDLPTGSFVQVRLEDFGGDNLYKYVPLEGRNDDLPGTGENEYSQNRVVCLTCHVAHGTGNLAGAVIDPTTGLPAVAPGLEGEPLPDAKLPGLEVAYRNNALNRTTEADVPEAFTPESQALTTGTVEGRSPLAGYLFKRKAFGQIEGLSSVLARFEPFASVCLRCHSAR